MTPRLRLFVALASLVFVVAHLRALPRTLEDIDSINFALGVEHFDVALHRPHPPGYPVFIGLARASTRAIAWIAPGWDRDRRAAAGLAFWGLVAGTCAMWVFTEFWMAVGLAPPVAFLAALLAVMSPLFWFTAARPLSDTPALVLSLAVATGLLRGLRGLHSGTTSLPWSLLASAAIAGLIIGVRTQTMWLTGPLLGWIVGELLVRRRVRDALVLAGAAAAGALLWAVPLVIVTGGLSRYLESLTWQGTQDFAAIEMLATSPTWRMLRASLSRTFVGPWEAATLANVVLVLAMIGLARLVRAGRRVLAAISLVFWPYLVFHLTFHETVTLRYALPLVVPVAGLAVIGLSLAGTRLAVIGGTAAAVWSLIVVQPRLLAYANDGAPVFRAFQDMQSALPATTPAPDIHMHHQVFWGIERVAEWYRPFWNIDRLLHPGSREWLSVVNHFAGGDDRPAWFLSDVTRNDLTQFDPRATTRRGHYVLVPQIRQLVGGARLDSLDWWAIERPGWMLGSGWSLTPEVGGMTDQDRTGPHLRPAEAFLRRGSAPMRVLIGGRDLAPQADPGVVSIEIDGQPLDQLQVSRDLPQFVRWIDLPAGTPAGSTPYARLSVRILPVLPGHPAPPVGLEQFDAAAASVPMYAFADGWHELEEDPATGRLWRWTSAKSALELRAWQPVTTLVIEGESPLRYFDHSPTIVVRAGDREISRFTPVTDFLQSVSISGDALQASGGRLTIETDLTFSPAERHQSADQRRLGLKLTRVEIQ